MAVFRVKLMEINSNGCFPGMFLLHHVFSRQEFQALPVFGYFKCTMEKNIIFFTTWENFYLGHEFSKHRNHKQIQGNGKWLYMGVSKNNGIPKSSILKLVFHYKPSILGYPYFWRQWYEIPFCFSNFRPTTPGGVQSKAPPHTTESGLMSLWGCAVQAGSRTPSLWV